MQLFLIITMAFATQLRNLESTDICYGVILDAGSSSTKTSVYQWKCRSSQTYPDIDISIQAPNLKTKPGIATVYPDQVSAYLTEIFDFLSKNIPTAQKARTPIFLGATAGMRLLNINKQNALIDIIRTQFAASGYLFENSSWARVISGQDEASYLWLTVKYLLNNAIISTIDLGGASSQIAFTVTQQPYNSNINNITIPGQQMYPLYSISYLGYGIDQARISVISKSKSGGNVIMTPCYHAGYTATWSDDSSYTISGTGNYQQCLQLISNFINSNCRSGNDTLCGIDQIDQPLIPDLAEIYAVSGVATIASFYNLTDYKLPELYAKSIQYCSLSWNQIQADSVYSKNSYANTNYFMSLYAYQLLSLGYNIPDTRIVHSPLIINMQTPTWGMAAVQYQLAQVTCNQDSPFCSAYILSIFSWTKDSCYSTEKVIKGEGITIEQQGEFTKSFNNYRNGIAMGKIPNWENKGMTASLMNYIQWDNKLAALAQECTNVCPQFIHTECKIPTQNGRVVSIKHVSSQSAFQQFNSDALVRLWTSQPETTKQLQQGDLTRFGCGIVQLEQIGQLPFREVIVCVFDKNVLMNVYSTGIIYQGGPIGSQCPNGVMNSHPALCKL